MKKFYILIILVLTSCRKDNCVLYLIENETENDLILILFEGREESFSYEIDSNTSFTQLSECDRGGWSLSYDYFDSIQVQVNNIVKKTYYPESPGKNIYNVDDRDSWLLVVNRKHYQKFVFEITEEDLK
ncbi:hypothetical protein ACFOUP_10090 [Belliella kenyensis]|uniref:Lipoprotein n=1 Tax=Belliella kenyensis TaxID=1472724 RepID=A0ABV8EKD0_9BACT|nr:hypothetical protein [Belliella kenyensis]MCH7403286.1 hypothetical protein [Belliella kenyensis]MDN3602927.1 hypothetical protein [Belliella kenyensis]